MNSNEYTKKVNGASFYWDMDRGLFQFEGEDVVLFWIDTAFKTFLDTIEEIAGEESARVVMETTGYRTGKIVSGFYSNYKSGSVEDVLEILPQIYKSAGWGAYEIREFSLDKKEAVVVLREDWELKINCKQDKKEPGSFLAGHWAGVLSGLLEENIWYEIVEHPFFGHEETVIKYAPSDVTPTENVRDLLTKREREEIMRLEAVVEDRTKDLQNLVQDLSSPIIPVLDHIVVIPLMGKFDEYRSNELIEKTLQGVIEYRSNIIIFDVTAMKEMDEYAIRLLENVTQAVSLVGATPILVGITADLSIQLVNNGIYLNDLKCFATLKHAVHYGLSLEGLQIASQ
ncbi:MAG TPA: STAS domain-containing protein [Bacillaceae bacterium]